ncbi:MAG: hypothetical protein ABI690_05795 [Chloroflexota bacterium]
MTDEITINLHYAATKAAAHPVRKRGDNALCLRRAKAISANMRAAADRSRMPADLLPTRRRFSSSPPSILAHLAAVPVLRARQYGGKVCNYSR